MGAKKVTVETSVSTTFAFTKEELLALLIPHEERRPRCNWWILDTGEGRVELVRNETVRTGFDEEGRERPEQEREDGSQ